MRIFFCRCDEYEKNKVRSNCIHSVFITLKNRQKKTPVPLDTGKTRSLKRLKLETLMLISMPI
ncbi:hypothetical protein COJ81_11340 [Bacillus cereus]|nr:hypothetical protein COJ81_11340 [Bacillus cereus]